MFNIDMNIFVNQKMFFDSDWEMTQHLTIVSTNYDLTNVIGVTYISPELIYITVTLSWIQ